MISKAMSCSKLYTPLRRISQVVTAHARLAFDRSGIGVKLEPE
jgi:hypothetical protein